MKWLNRCLKKCKINVKIAGLEVKCSFNSLWMCLFKFCVKTKKDTYSYNVLIEYTSFELSMSNPDRRFCYHVNTPICMLNLHSCYLLLIFEIDRNSMKAFFCPNMFEIHFAFTQTQQIFPIFQPQD